MKLRQSLAQLRAARALKRKEKRQRLFWQNYRAARRCERGFYLVRVGWDADHHLAPILAWRRNPVWHVRGLIEVLL